MLQCTGRRDKLFETLERKKDVLRLAINKQVNLGTKKNHGSRKEDSEEGYTTRMTS